MYKTNVFRTLNLTMTYQKVRLGGVHWFCKLGVVYGTDALQYHRIVLNYKLQKCRLLYQVLLSYTLGYFCIRWAQSYKKVHGYPDTRGNFLKRLLWILWHFEAIFRELFSEVKKFSIDIEGLVYSILNIAFNAHYSLGDCKVLQ